MAAYTEEKKEFVIAPLELRKAFIEAIRRHCKQNPLIAENFAGVDFVRVNRIPKEGGEESSIWVAHSGNICATITRKGPNEEEWETFLFVRKL